MWADDKWLSWFLSNDTWHTFDERNCKENKLVLIFFCWKVCVMAATTHTRGHISPCWQHAAFAFRVVASGRQWEERRQNPAGCRFVAHLCTSILPLREPRKSGTAGLSHAPISPSQSEGFSQPCRVFNMEIGFEPHLHRSAHLRAKLRYRWQGKWTINSS